MNKFFAYPEIQDKDFYEKIYRKKEFYDTKNKLSKSKENSDFTLSSSQTFLKNYISESTPYNGILIFHGTGVGKTCAAISIAERFRNRVSKTGKKNIIIVEKSIQNEFIKTIFDFEKELTKKNPRTSVQCTGKTYKSAFDSKFITTKKKELQISKMIYDIYELTGRVTLKNKLLNETGWDGNQESLSENIKKKIKQIYSDRVIIIDEVHNNINKKDINFPVIIKEIIKNSENVILILMSATPMVNSPSDILFSLELLHLNNDKSFDISTKKIFKSNDEFADGGVEILKELSKGYISYVRGGETPRFPYKIIPKEAKLPTSMYFFDKKRIDKDQKIKFSYLIQCPMEDFQYKIYKNALQNELQKTKKENVDNENDIYNSDDISKGGLLPMSLQASNIVYPISKSRGVIGNDAYGDSKLNITPIVETKDYRGNVTYSYSSLSKGFLLRENIIHYSKKFATIFDNIITSKGIAFVHSKWIPSGIIPFALMLEENGFEQALITGKEYPLFYSNTKKNPICYKCNKTRHPKTDHVWSSAKYVILMGSADINMQDKAKITGYTNREENIDGKLVRLILGSSVASEGIDFKRIRQVHIMEPKFNQAKIDQVEGRAIRNLSHSDLPKEQQNVEIFKYCSVPSKKHNDKIETVDEYIYRIAEDKDKKIKKVENILKQVAVDCLYQKNNNTRTEKSIIKLEDSRGNKITYVSGDTPYSRECSYEKKCDYNCIWEPTKNINIDKSTYGIDFSDGDIEISRKLISKLYKKNFIIDVKTLFKNIHEINPSIEDIYIYLALDDFLNKDSGYVINDMYGREGYLVEKGELILFQPFELENTNSPFIYKKIPFETKKKEIPFSLYGSQIKSSNKKIVGNDIFMKCFKYYNYCVNVINNYIQYPNNEDIIISIVLNKLSDKETIVLLKYIVSPDYKPPDEHIKFYNLSILYYEKQKNIYRKNNKIAIMISNFIFQWGKTKFSGKERHGWGKCEPNVENTMVYDIKNYNHNLHWGKIDEKDKISEGEEIQKNEYISFLKSSNNASKYIGMIETKYKNGPKTLKILNFEERTKNNTSKRTQLRGRDCLTLEVSYIKNLLNKLEKNITDIGIEFIKNNEKKLRLNICIKMEFLFKLLHIKTDKIWIIDSFFTDDDYNI